MYQVDDKKNEPSLRPYREHIALGLNWVRTKDRSVKTMFVPSLRTIRASAAVEALRAKVESAKPAIIGGTGAGVGFLAAGAGNYTAQNTPVTTSAALANIGDYVAFVLDVLTAMSNWFLTNAVGELIIGETVVMFAFIMIKSLFRRGGGRRR